MLLSGKALDNWLNGQRDMEVAGEAEDGRQALEKVKSFHPDVILLDIAMPHLNGLEVISLNQGGCSRNAGRCSLHALQGNLCAAGSIIGCSGLRSQASPSTDILEAIRMAHRNEYFLSSRLKAEVIGKYLKTKRSAPALRGYDLPYRTGTTGISSGGQGHSTSGLPISSASARKRWKNIAPAS